MITFRGALVRLCLAVVGVAAIVVVIVSAILRPVDGATDDYSARFSDVYGLKAGADVRLRGVQVGKVVKIELADGREARVHFTIQRKHRLSAAQTLAVRFQNLIGQRYLDIVTRAATDGCGGTNPSQEIPSCRTVPSLDMTVLFNGLRPLMREMRPEVLNNLGKHVQAVLQGESSDGLSRVTADIAELLTYAADRDKVITRLMSNFRQLHSIFADQDKSITELADVLESVFVTVRPAIPGMRSLLSEGLVPLTQLGDIVDQLTAFLTGGTRLGKGPDQRVERITKLFNYVDVAQLVSAINGLPGLVDGVQGLLRPGALVNSCRNGVAPMPRTVNLLIDGRAVTLCRP